MLLDEGSFEELDTYVEHDCIDFGMEEQRIRRRVSPIGYDHGRLIFVFSQDFVFGGSLSKRHAEDLQGDGYGAEVGAPVIGLNDWAVLAFRKASPRWVVMPKYFSATCWHQTWCRRSASSWGRAGRGGLLPAMTDFIFMVKDSPTCS